MFLFSLYIKGRGGEQSTRYIDLFRAKKKLLKLSSSCPTCRSNDILLFQFLIVCASVVSYLAFVLFLFVYLSF